MSAAPENDAGNRWRGRPVLSAGLRLVILGVPLLLGYAASVLGARLLTAQLAQTRWWLLAVVAISIAVCFGTERLTRRLLPLAALLKLSMLFPDTAPNRFKLARGAVSTKLLNERVAHARTRDAGAVAAAVLALITALTAHDRRTRGHCERVRVFTELLAEQLHLPRDARDKLRWASLLHDVGKLHISPEILNKPAKLTDTEFKLVAHHPAHGEELLGPLIGWLGEWGAAVRQHHEQYDGSGYPDGLAGSDICRAARIVSIADSYEVMTAHRAYKKPMATVAARAELARCAGTQFDPLYVRAFLSIPLPRLLWAMGPGALAMNLPLLRVLADSTNKGLLALPQGAVAAGTAAVVIGTAAVAPMPVALASAPVAGTATTVVGGTPPGRSILPPVPTSSRTDAAGRPGSVDVTEGPGMAPTSAGPAGSPGADPTDPTGPTGLLGPNADPSAAESDGPGAAAGSSPGPSAAGPTSAGPSSAGPASVGPTSAGPTPAGPAPTPSAPTTAAPSMAAPTLISTPAALGLGPTATFTWSQVAGLSYEYQLDNGSWTVVGASNTVTKTVLLGAHTFRLRARVGAGSPTPTTSYTFTVIL